MVVQVLGEEIMLQIEPGDRLVSCLMLLQTE